MKQLQFIKLSIEKFLYQCIYYIYKMKKLILIISLIALSLILVSCRDKEEITGNVIGTGSDKEQSCEDTDGGIVPDVKGILRIGDMDYADACVSGILIEYYCDGNQKANQNIRCPNKCLNGKCN